MMYLRDIWNVEEADFKPLDVLSNQFGLNEEEFEKISLMDDYITKAYAHLLIQPSKAIVVGD